MRRGTSFLSTVNAHRYLQFVVIMLLVLTCANLLFCALHFEFGYGVASIIGTGPTGPDDRFADLLKIGFSYPQFRPGIKLETFLSWPRDIQAYFIQPGYRGVEGLDMRGNETHFHQPPLTTLYLMSSAAFVVLTQSIWLDLSLFYLLYLATSQWAIWVGVPRERRTVKLILVTLLFAVVSSPALFILCRGNFNAGFTSLMITAFLLCLFVRARASLPALLSLAIAVNLRPNAIIFVLVLPLVLGLKQSIKPLIKFAAITLSILICSYLAVHRIYPDYTVEHFLIGLALYKKIYVTGGLADGANNSLLGLIKNYTRMSTTLNPLLLLLVLICTLLSLVFLVVQRPSKWVLAAPLSLPFLYALFLLYTHKSPDVFAVNSVASAILAVIVCAGLWRSTDRLLIAPFIFTAMYCLLCPVFADYHLLVFVAPMLIAYLGEYEPVRNRLLFCAIGLFSVVLLSPKNYVYVNGLSMQTVINPLLVYGGMFFLVQETMALPQRSRSPEPEPSQEDVCYGSHI